MKAPIAMWRGEPVFQTWADDASEEEFKAATNAQIDEIDARLGPGPEFFTLLGDAPGDDLHVDERPDEGIASMPRDGTLLRVRKPS
jgi:hypothetical protein